MKAFSNVVIDHSTCDHAARRSSGSPKSFKNRRNSRKVRGCDTTHSRQHHSMTTHVRMLALTQNTTLQEMYTHALHAYLKPRGRLVLLNRH